MTSTTDHTRKEAGGQIIRFRLTAALSVAALIILVAVTPVVARQPLALGVSMSADDGRDLDALTAFEDSIGGAANRPATWSIWIRWGDPNHSRREFPTAVAADLRDRGVTPVIWWEPWKGASDPNRYFWSSNKRILRGDHDDYIHAFAKAAGEHAGPVILRYAHEANSHWFPWGVGRFDNTKESQKKAWRYVRNIFKEEGAGNVKFLWSVAKQSCNGCNPYKATFPGNKYVDYVGFTAFNWGTHAEHRWVPMVKSYAQPMKKLRQFTNKPIIVAETASNHKGGDKAKWIKNGYNKVYDRWGKIRAIIWLNTDAPKKTSGHPDWRLVKPNDGSALAAYASVAEKAKFHGSLP